MALSWTTLDTTGRKRRFVTRTTFWIVPWHLLSPHLFRSGEWDRSKLEAKDPQPLEATKGLTFKLEGEETVLHCRITDVEYLASLW